MWITSRSYADCHEFINEHDDELVREVLKYDNSELLRQIACNSQVYSDSLVLLALRMIHRHPLSLTVKDTVHAETALQWAQDPQFNTCHEILSVLSLEPLDISSTPFPTLLRQHLPKQFVDSSIFGTYNTACTFIKHMKYDKAELVEIEAVLKPSARSQRGRSTRRRARRRRGWVAATEAELRTLHKGMALLNMCIQRPGAEDRPTSVVLGFLLPGPAY